MMKCILGLLLSLTASSAFADLRSVYLEDLEGTRIKIATLDVNPQGSYSLEMSAAPFSDHFLSMRPFRCMEGPAKHWCHVPYPYEIERNLSETLTDVEYDFLFVWKGANDYGINMWNGVYYEIEQQDMRLVGTLFEIDMNVLAVPPPKGELRPVQGKDLHESDPESHWLPRLVIE